MGVVVGAAAVEVDADFVTAVVVVGTVVVVWRVSTAMGQKATGEIEYYLYEQWK